MAANLPSGHYRPTRKRLTFPAYFRQLPQNSHSFWGVIPLAAAVTLKLMKRRAILGDKVVVCGVAEVSHERRHAMKGRARCVAYERQGRSS